MFETIKNTVLGNNSINGLQEKSKAVLVMFDKAINDLSSINEQITVQQKEKELTVAEIQKELEQLNTLKQQNSKVIGNINNIIS